MIWLVYHDKEVNWRDGYVIKKLHTDFDHEEDEYFTLMLTSPMCLRCFRIFLQAEYPDLIKAQLRNLDWAWDTIIRPFAPADIDEILDSYEENIENVD